MAHPCRRPPTRGHPRPLDAAVASCSGSGSGPIVVPFVASCRGCRAIQARPAGSPRRYPARRPRRRRPAAGRVNLMSDKPPLGHAGPPGTRWRNTTGEVWYQWLSSLRKPCATCLKRHGRIFAELPERPHPNCECEFLEIQPGDEAPIEFRTPGGLAAMMPTNGQVQLVGALNWMLQSAGLVSWDDLFDEDGEARDFKDTVKRKRLTIAQLVAAGINETVARRAAGLDPLAK
jgi:hypothetical protein